MQHVFSHETFEYIIYNTAKTKELVGREIHTSLASKKLDPRARFPLKFL
jgi:hypothetical protein